MARVTFAIRCLFRILKNQERSCPYCGLNKSELIGRKKILLELRRCGNCLLMYRFPKDESTDSEHFYQTEYREGMTTGLPDHDLLKSYIENDFRGTEKDLSDKIAIIKKFQQNGRLLDYGCSWGYGVYQFARMGYEVVGFEISHRRASFGEEKLGVKIMNETEELLNLTKGSFDIIFANHVLEHLNKIQDAFNHFQYLLRENGLLFVFVPNGGGFFARSLGTKWGPMIGEKHPIALDAHFFAKNLPSFGFKPLFRSSPFVIDDLKFVYEADSEEEERLMGEELLVVARKICC